jgi:hypothetical protein
MNLTLALPKKDNGAIPRHFLKQCIRKDCGLPDLGVRRKPTKIRVRDEASYPPSGNALCSRAGPLDPQPGGNMESPTVSPNTPNEFADGILPKFIFGERGSRRKV